MTTYTSNDPDYLAELIAAQSENAYIIDVNRYKSFNELVGEIKQVDDGFDVTKGVLLNALNEGKTVILNGEISLALYQQLLPLLSETPHIYFNGARITPDKGKLVLVMPNSVKNNMSLLLHEEQTFN